MLDAEPLRAAPDLAVEDRLRGRDGHELRRDGEAGTDLRVELRERLADDVLGRVRPVRLGGVDEGDPEVDRLADQRRRHLVRVLVPVAPLARPELPRPEPDDRQPEPGRFDISHGARVYGGSTGPSLAR